MLNTRSSHMRLAISQLRNGNTMNTILFAVLALNGADGAYASHASGGYSAECDTGNSCGECGSGRRCKNGEQNRRGMPQSCYNPSFGCYASTRFMHRYPAFHGHFAREAYNYRQYFDYPWHAGMHEPTSMFSYNVPGESPAEAVPAPAPIPDTARHEPTPAFRSAGYFAPIVSPIQATRR